MGEWASSVKELLSLSMGLIFQTLISNRMTFYPLSYIRRLKMDSLVMFLLPQKRFYVKCWGLGYRACAWWPLPLLVK